MRNKPVLLILGFVLLETVLIHTTGSPVLSAYIMIAAGLIAIVASGRMTQYYMDHPPYEGLQPKDGRLVRFVYILFGVSMLVFGALTLL